MAGWSSVKAWSSPSSTPPPGNPDRHRRGLHRAGGSRRPRRAQGLRRLVPHHPAQRAAALLAIADAVEANAEQLARLESLNCGKPLHLARQDDIPATADVFRFFAGAVRCQQGQLAGEYVPGHTSMVRRDPVGVVASIAPWNYP